MANEDYLPTDVIQTVDTLGVSVHHLKNVFLENLVCNSSRALSRCSRIYEIEDLQGPDPGVIRQHSATVTCPLDGKKGASYVHCLDGVDHVGQATHMLSYSWR